MAFDRSKFLSQFRAEVLERLEAVSYSLVELEKYPENMDVYETVKREFHTLKGITSLMGFNRTSEMFHKLEDLFRNSNNLQRSFDRSIYDFLFKCIDIVHSVFKNDKIKEDLIAEFADSVVSKYLIPSPKKDFTVTPEKPLKTEKVNDKKELLKVNTKSVKPEFTEETDKVKVEASQLTDLINFSNEVLMAKSMLKDTLNKLESNVNEGKIINFDDYCSDFNRLNEVYEKLDRYSGAISHLAVSMRMISLDNLFNLYIRPVREMAKSYGVKINLKFDGEKTLLDKDVLKYIIDPVLHILRNAIDHGIESSEERTNNGKTEFGTIQFKAYQRNSRIYIEISDDGRGIDFKKLKNKIFQNGLAGLKEVNTFTEDKLLSFLFYHGFSTKDTVDMLSGRGVGLDVVKEKIEAINGSVRINSTYGKGTTITLILPLTLSITESLLVEAGAEVFAIPTDYIKEVRRLDYLHIKENEKGSLECTIDDKVIPAVNLCQYLNIETKYLLGSNKLLQVVVIYSGDSLFCIVVDKILTYIDTVVKPLLPVKGQLRAFLGGTVTGEGRAVLVLDVPSLTISAKNVNNKFKTTNLLSLDNNSKGLRILLAEDSVNIAEIEKNILESAGFYVSIASGGKTAYNMAVTSKYDIIISDILMPGMNGIEFVKLLREKDYYSKTPIIMVTSRNNSTDKTAAFAAGANEYVLKSELTSANIITVIKKYLKNKDK